MSRLSVAFVVQGEGRGHMTQALALAEFLRDAGHEVRNVLVGTSPYRSVPDYFPARIGAPVDTFPAPTQVPDRSGRGVSGVRTATDVARRLPSFVRAVFQVQEATGGVDVVVNFLDLVGGLATRFRREGPPSVAVAHNYLFLHPAMAGAPGPALTHRAVLAYAGATAVGARTRVALSFDERTEGDAGPVTIAPPLLRAGLDRLEVRREGYLLAYALNPGYGADLVAWQRRHPDVEVHCYLDGGTASMVHAPPPGFHVHDLDERAFLDHLAGCRAYLGSAGFESICEAFYLGKPVLAVPTAGQHEQVLNAWDAERVGAARAGTYADLDRFWSDPPTPSAQRVEAFRDWVRRAPHLLVDAVERTAASGR